MWVLQEDLISKRESNLATTDAMYNFEHQQSTTIQSNCFLYKYIYLDARLMNTQTVKTFNVDPLLLT